MANLSDTELLSLVSQMEAEAESDRSTRSAQNDELERRYNGELYGTEEEGRSSVISQDVKDIVESDMPGLVRTILGSGPVMKFKANNPNDEKQVTEQAYDNPKFVEDIVRDLALKFDALDELTTYQVTSENFESIHNHNAFAFIERDKRG